MLRRLFESTILFGLAALISTPVHANGLFNAGATVQAFYYNGVFASPEGEISVGGSSSNPTSLAASVDYQQGAASGSTIHVGDVQIVIKNVLPSSFPFCFANTPGTACVDQIDGFDFKFTGENILGVSVDPASAASFLPVNGTFQGNTHLGLQLLSNNEIQVDVTGDLPNVNDQLILDLSFVSTAPVPGPTVGAGLPGLLAGFGAMLAWYRRRRPARVVAQEADDGDLTRTSRPPPGDTR